LQSGETVNPSTGLLTWTPTAAQVHEKYAELKLASAERCAKALGAIIKRSEIQFHHEVTNQYLWGRF